jgi:hypothetical protein
MKKRIPHAVLTLMTSGFVLWTSQAHAGRPMAVDDANVNEKGAGHVEVWVARDSQQIDTWNLAPAFAPIVDLEIGVSHAKARKNGPAEQAIQAKWRITPSQENGCNVASTLGSVHEKSVGSSPYLVGILSCNWALGSAHVNLTRHHPKDEKNTTAGAWPLNSPWAASPPTWKFLATMLANSPTKSVPKPRSPMACNSMLRWAVTVKTGPMCFPWA